MITCRVMRALLGFLSVSSASLYCSQALVSVVNDEEKRVSPVQIPIKEIMVSAALQDFKKNNNYHTYSIIKKNNGLFSEEESVDYGCRLEALLNSISCLSLGGAASPDAAGPARENLLYESTFYAAMRYLAFLKERGYTCEEALKFDPNCVVESSQLDLIAKTMGVDKSKLDSYLWPILYKLTGSRFDGQNMNDLCSVLYKGAQESRNRSSAMLSHLIDLVRVGSIEGVQAFIDRVDVDAADEYGGTPLLYAALYRQEPIVALLLDKKASPNIPNSAGIVPLLLCDEQGIKRSKTEVIADVNAKNRSSAAKQSILDLYAEVERFNKKAETIKDLLQKAGASFDAVDEKGNSLLARAAFNGHDIAVQAYIGHDADVFMKNKDGQNALLYALNNFNYFSSKSKDVDNCLRAIIKKATDLNKINDLINQVDATNNCTALNYASQKCRCGFGKGVVSSNSLCVHRKMIDTLRNDLGAKTYNQLCAAKDTEKQNVHIQRELKKQEATRIAAEIAAKKQLKQEKEAAEEAAKIQAAQAKKDAKKSRYNKKQEAQSAKKAQHVAQQKEYELRQQELHLIRLKEAEQSEKKKRMEQGLDVLAQELVRDAISESLLDVEYHVFSEQFKKIFDQFDRGYDDPEIFKQRAFAAYKQYLKEQYNLSSYRKFEDKDMLYVLCQISRYCADEIRKLNVIKKAVGAHPITVYSAKVKSSPVIDRVRLHNRLLDNEYQQEFTTWCAKGAKDASDEKIWHEWCVEQQFCS